MRQSSQHAVLGLVRRETLVPALALLATVAGAACAALLDPPDVRIADVRVGGIGLSGATADVVLQVKNPNGFALTAEGLRYQLDFLDPDASMQGEETWHAVTSGRTTDRIHVPGNDSSTVTVEVPFQYEDLGRAMLGLLREGGLDYRLTGDVMFDGPVGDVRVPFRDTGRVEP